MPQVLAQPTTGAATGIKFGIIKSMNLTQFGTGRPFFFLVNFEFPFSLYFARPGRQCESESKHIPGKCQVHLPKKCESETSPRTGLEEEDGKHLTGQCEKRKAGAGASAGCRNKEKH